MSQDIVRYQLVIPALLYRFLLLNRRKGVSSFRLPCFGQLLLSLTFKNSFEYYRCIFVVDKGNTSFFFFFLMDIDLWHMVLGFIRPFSVKYIGFLDCVPPPISPPLPFLLFLHPLNHPFNLHHTPGPFSSISMLYILILHIYVKYRIHK